MTAQWIYPPENTPEVSIDYINETLTGFEDADYTINNAAVQVGEGGTLAISSDWFGKDLSIVRKGNGATTSDSAAQSLAIPARPEAPAGLTAHNTSTGLADDGKITGLESTKAYQYSVDGTNWTDIPAGGTEITNLAAGTYYVRLAAVEHVSFASASATFTVQKSTTPVVPKFVRYIVEHYKAAPNSSTGYTLADTEYFIDEIGKTVTAAPKTYDGYVYNEKQSTASGVLEEIKSESDILILKLYYDLMEFTVTVETEGQGTAFASPASAMVGESITLTASADSDYRFKAWEVVAGGISISGNQFVMPAEHVTVKAIFEKHSNSGGSSGGGSSSSDNSSSSGSLGSRSVSAGTWVRDEIGWWYQKADGTYPVSCWQKLAYGNTLAWYHFDERGYMQTGWFTDAAGRTYYLHAVSDGRQGYMYTGWHKIDGVWYYFREVQDGTEGALYKNTHTPDGYWVDENGMWKP